MKMKNYDIKKNTIDECLDYWDDPKDHNIPENYRDKDQRSRYLVSMLRRYNIPEKSKILEIGCNCCRNLDFLYRDNYKKLTGLEISRRALEAQKDFFPGLKAELIHSSIEDHILKFKTNEFNFTFSMAVLQHIHRDSDWIFSHIARITKGWVMFIESDDRNYNKIMEANGFTLLDKRNCNMIKGLQVYKMRIYQKNGDKR